MTFGLTAIRAKPLPFAPGKGLPRNRSHEMNRSIPRLAGALSLLLTVFLPLALHAQSLPRPREFYFDQDATTTRPLVLVEGADEATQQKLAKAMGERGRRADLATAQLARIAYASGRADTGDMLYARVVARVDRNDSLYRPLLWNRGWDRYRSGDAEGALASWREAGVEARGNPAWVPPTLALVLWTLDRRDEALQWYAAAVRTEPTQWRDPANLPALLPDWREADRAKLAEVAAAWQAAPPAWP